MDKLYRHAMCMAVSPSGILMIIPRGEYWTRAKPAKLKIPGGGIDGGENPFQAAIRELREETCFKGEIDEVLGLVIDSEDTVVRYLYVVWIDTPITGADIGIGNDGEHPIIIPTIWEVLDHPDLFDRHEPLILTALERGLIPDT